MVLDCKLRNRCRASIIIYAYRAYLIICQFGTRMIHASKDTITLSPTLHHVGGVVFVRAYSEMSRIAAGRIVTLVENKMSFWYRADQQFIGDTMCANSAPIDVQFAIATTGGCACPQPTAFWTIGPNISPKSLNERLAGIVTAYVSEVLSLDPTARAIRFRNGVRSLPASALAIAIGYFLRGLFCGIVRHVDDLQSSAMQPDVSPSRLRFVDDMITQVSR